MKILMSFYNKASRGEYPWIFDTNDHSNIWTGVGLPLDALLSHQLIALFERCFGVSRVHTGIVNVRVGLNGMFYNKSVKCFYDAKTPAVI